MNTKNWKLKDVLLIAISAVLFGVVYLGCTYIGGVLYGMLTPFGMASLGYEPFYGIYFMAGAFGIYVMRKPGTGLIAELLAAVLEGYTATGIEVTDAYAALARERLECELKDCG